MTMSEFNAFDADAEARSAYIVARWNQAHEAHGGQGFMVFDGHGIMMLWQSLSDSFIEGNWIAVVLAAHAMCERTLAVFYDMADLPGSRVSLHARADRATLGTFIGWGRADGILDSGLADDIQDLCDRRKVLTHLKPPLSPGTVMTRLMAWEPPNGVEKSEERLMADDAGAALDVVFGLCFGDVADRSFGR